MGATAQHHSRRMAQLQSHRRTRGVTRLSADGCSAQGVAIRMRILNGDSVMAAWREVRCPTQVAQVAGMAGILAAPGRLAQLKLLQSALRIGPSRLPLLRLKCRQRDACQCGHEQQGHQQLGQGPTCQTKAI